MLSHVIVFVFVLTLECLPFFFVWTQLSAVHLERKAVVISFFIFFDELCTYKDDVCTGNSTGTAPAGTKCASHCVHWHGNWGANYCYTDKDQKQWGAECVPCKGLSCE